MSISIEIYPSKKNINVLALLKQELTKYSNDLEYSNNLSFVQTINGESEIEIESFVFDEQINMSLNKVIGPYANSLFLNSSRIDDVFTASFRRDRQCFCKRRF